MRLVLSAVTLAVLATLPASAFAHSGEHQIRHVAADGRDSGNCEDAKAPCQTLAYAFSRAGKGDSVRVAAGNYRLTGDERVLLISGAVPVEGGYSRADGFRQRDPARNATILSGIPHAYRTELGKRGFDLQQDDKGAAIELSVKEQALLNTWQKAQKSMAPAETCDNGKAGTYECSNVDLLAHVPLSQFSGAPANANDIWGFVDRNDGREYILIGLSNGTAVVDVTDPTHPRTVGQVNGLNSMWRDMHVVQLRDGNRWHAWAYVTTEAVGQGLQVIDLGGLPNSISEAGNIRDIQSAHTLFSNVDYTYGTPFDGITPHLYVDGSRLPNGSRSGEWRAYKLDNPAAPQFVVAAPPGNGYVHDAAGMIIRDERTAQCANGHNPCEVLIDFNEDTLDLWDVTDKAAPVRLSRTPYPQASYTHSGWPTEDLRHIVLHDELDERDFGIKTLLRTFDISDLRNPVLSGTTTGRSNAIDHNGYILNNRLYVSHYRRGLVIYDSRDPNHLNEVGYFDSSFLYPDATAFNGAWGTYPFLKSGTVGISDIEGGLYLVDEYTRDRGPGRLAFADTSVSAQETAGTLRVGVRRFNGKTGALSVNIKTVNGTALAGQDFTAVDSQLQWADGERGIKYIDVPLLNDTAVENSESFSLQISVSSGGATIADKTSLPVTLNSEDSTPPPPVNSGGGGGGGGIGGSVALLALLLIGRRERNCWTTKRRAPASR